MTQSFAVWLAHRLPRKVVHWAFIRVLAEASIGEYSGREVTDIKWTEALDAWDATP